MNKDNTTSVEENEIDIIELVKNLWDSRKTVIWYVAVCFVLGLMLALFSPKEYTANTIILPDSSSSQEGGVGALAAIAGVSLGTNNADVISPALYDQVVGSTPFQLDLMYSEFNCPDVEGKISLYDYYIEHKSPGFFYYLKKYTIGLPGLVMKMITSEDEGTMLSQEDKIMSLTKEESVVKGAIKSILTLSYDEKVGSVTISSVTGDALLSAQIAETSKNLLQDYVTTAKIAKAKEHLKFVEARFNEKKSEFSSVQKELAAFKDKNRDVGNALARINLEHLQTQYNLAFSVYSELAKQYEAALIKVKEDTPIFTVLEPVQVPLKPSAPRKMLILVGFLFLGGILGVGVVLGKRYIAMLKEKWDEY